MDGAYFSALGWFRHRRGLIEDEVLHELERDLDVEELAMTLQRGEPA